MTNYKRKLKRRLIYITIVFGFAIVGSVIVFTKFPQQEGRIPFFAGLLSSLGIITIFVYAQYFKMMRNPNKLKEEQIKEEDERNQLIEQKVDSQSFTIFMTMLAILCIVFVFVNFESTVLIGGLLWLGILVKLGVSMYYKRKF